ncbi:hypothetical protein N836_15695 [Leptolyngbya sp. Heron Island J]|uniref:hypothetical protein n=1 Tax=Leptolyngbya sp. Heron Island J TaxID=1385935 RepID=UPI0003B95D78|nr:hypothetical protein [Leptolyngbya sp. Heron Island J]ESA34859.1 hypothetical protein N836_15695 [Leptolyngbya sp. Heron Island J]
MVNSNLTKLPQIPWPALAGVSLLLHAGALIVSLPVMLQVDVPDSSSVNIPVTLVDETVAPIAPPEQLPASVSSPEPEPPLGGQNPTVVPQVSNQPSTQPPPQPETTSQKPVTEPPVNTETTEKPATEPDNSSETPNEVAPESPPLSENQPSVEEDVQNPTNEIGDGSISINIVGTPTVPPGTPGDWPDVLPKLQSTSTLIVADHACNDALPAGEVTVGLVIDANGSVLQVFPPPDQDTLAAQVASCLLTHTLSVNPNAIQFAPAYTGQQAIITDRMQLTLQFSTG